MKIICNVFQKYHKEYSITFYQISNANMVIKQENKMPTGLDGHLSTIALTVTGQRVSVFHFKLIKSQRAMGEGRGGQESEDSNIIYILAPGVKICILLVKRDLQAFNCQSFIILIFIYYSYNMHAVCFDKHTMHWKLM